MRDFRHFILLILLIFICSCASNNTNNINETNKPKVFNYSDVTVTIEYNTQLSQTGIDTYNASCEVSIEPSVINIGFPLVEYETVYYVIVEGEIKPIIFHSISFCSSGCPFYCFTLDNKKYTGTMLSRVGRYNQIFHNEYLMSNIYSSIEEAKHCILTGDEPAVKYATLAKIMEDYVQDSNAIYVKHKDSDFILKSEHIDRHKIYCIDNSGTIYPSMNKIKYIYYKNKNIHICYDNNVFTSIDDARKSLYNIIF